MQQCIRLERFVKGIWLGAFRCISLRCDDTWHVRLGNFLNICEHAPYGGTYITIVPEVQALHELCRSFRNT